MKTTKLFFMAALALMTAACSNDDNDLTTQQPQKAEGITITAQLAPKTSGANTRAVSDGTDKIVSEWAVNEHIAILYEVSSTKYAADARITAVDGTTGAATITFTVEGGTPNDTPCTLVYPYDAAKDDHTGVKDNSMLLGAQNGTLNANLDVRVGAGTIQTSTPSLTVTTQPAAQFAIWKLTLPQASKDMYVISEAGEFLAGAILSGTGTDFTVAVPAVSSKKVTIVATDGTSGCWSYSNTATLETGKYYQSTLTSMTALGTESSADVYKMTGAGTIPDGKTVVLSGVTISNSQIVCSGNATIILMGSNTVTGAANKAAIKIGDSGTTLTITGSGSLTATGNNGGAGIGTDYVQNGTSGGNIVINGGTVTATGGDYGAGIGTGRAVYANVTNTCGDITINGGTVTATGGQKAAGIGTGQAYVGSNGCGNITIGTGVISVTAKKSSSNPGPNSIGKGGIKSNGTQACGTITFGSAQVFDGSAWSPATMVAGTYGGLNLAITTTTNTDDTWTLTPAP